MQVPHKGKSSYTNLDPTRIIGSGSFGFVFEAIDNDTKQTVAVKRTQKAGEYVSREYEVLNELKKCKNVVKMLEIYYSKDSQKKTAQNLVFEYCSQNLEEIIQQKKQEGGRIEMKEIKDYMRQILTGMKDVHEKGIAHRDLKPENILKNEEGVIKICDFGSAKVLHDKLNTPYIVSRYYRAPELILACSDYTNMIDIWAIGCIFAEFMTLRPLFPGKTEGSQFIEQVAVLGLPKEEVLRKISSQITQNTIDLVHSLDDIPPRKIEELLPFKDYHPSDVKEAADLLSKMLRWIPSERITCKEALKHPFFGKKR